MIITQLELACSEIVETAADFSLLFPSHCVRSSISPRRAKKEQRKQEKLERKKEEKLRQKREEREAAAAKAAQPKPTPPPARPRSTEGQYRR